MEKQITMDDYWKFFERHFGFKPDYTKPFEQNKAEFMDKMDKILFTKP